MKYYAIFADGYYLETGLNSTSLEEVREAILSYIEFDYDVEERRTWAKIQTMTAEEICNLRGWTIDESNTPFEEIELEN